MDGEAGNARYVLHIVELLEHMAADESEAPVTSR